MTTDQNAFLTRQRIAAVLWLASGLFYLGAEAFAAAHVDGYTYTVGFISDLGRPAYSPMAAWMNSAFVTQGVAFGLAACLASTVVPRTPGRHAFCALAVCYGVGSTMVGLFHSGTGINHTAHVSGAVAALAGGNLALITAGAVLLRRGGRTRFAITGVVLGIAGIICAALLLVNGAADSPGPFRGGFWERGAVYTIIAWQLVAAVLLLIQKPFRVSQSRATSATSRQP